MQGIHSFTKNFGGLSNRPETPCFVSAAWLPQDDTTAPPLLEFNALWDTGATASVITQEVATKLELLPEGTAWVFHAQGSKRVPKYFVNLGLPNRVQVVGVEVLEGILKGCDVLIGIGYHQHGRFCPDESRWRYHAIVSNALSKSHRLRENTGRTKSKRHLKSICCEAVCTNTYTRCREPRKRLESYRFMYDLLEQVA